MTLPALHRAWTYALPLTAVAVAVGLITLVQEVVENLPVDLVLLFPVLASALSGGAGPTTVATILAVLAYGLLEVAHLSESQLIIHGAFLAGQGFCIAMLSEAVHLSRTQSRQTAIDRRRFETLETALREAGQQKDEFLPVLAHHLRNQLTPILTAAELLKEQGGREPSLVEWAGSTIERQARQVNRTITDVLDLSRLLRKELQLRNEVVDLKALIQEAVEDCRPLAENHKQTLGLQLPEGTLRVVGDRSRLRQVMDNLLSNAVKFTPAQGQVSVAACLEAGEAVVRVRDTGIGLEPFQVERIFAPFPGRHSSKTPDRAGLGIGLALSRGLVDIHDGSLIAHSQGPGKGSEFELRIPACNP